MIGGTPVRVRGCRRGPSARRRSSHSVSAMRPTASEFWYYLHDANKRLHPSRNAEEHEALRVKYNVY